MAACCLSLLCPGKEIYSGTNTKVLGNNQLQEYVEVRNEKMLF